MARRGVEAVGLDGEAAGQVQRRGVPRLGGEDPATQRLRLRHAAGPPVGESLGQVPPGVEGAPGGWRRGRLLAQAAFLEFLAAPAGAGIVAS